MRMWICICQGRSLASSLVVSLPLSLCTARAILFCPVLHSRYECTVLFVLYCVALHSFAPMAASVAQAV